MSIRRQPSSNVLKAHLGMLGWAVIVGSSFPVVGLLTQGLPPLQLTALRFAIAAGVLWPLVRLPSDRRPGLRALAVYALMGLCLASFFGAMFWAAHRTTALTMSVLYVSVPFLAYLFGRMLALEPRALDLPLILGAGAAGALALVWAEAASSGGSVRFALADAVFFAGCIGSALYPVLSKWGLERQLLSRSAAVRTFWSLAAGAVAIGVLGALAEGAGALARVTLRDLLIVGYLAVFSSGVTFWLMQRSTEVMTPGAVTAYTYLVPSVSMVVLFWENPALVGWQWLPGTMLVAAAIALLAARDTRGQLPARGHR
ncbi:DMT family transporter [Sediminicurvatus halobius]|uniref:EamA family transporter n=1 Tax=Sediminicurvatus halobius TaxID=2182432 RepID=A0A2U2N2S0_9GAMM|nr:DMT family transporter [Spiribacter halobius]PWG63531.1 EamA family transporter [Spiribacter halobius]UEX79595.1 DMT family transporter [Spiribacter halobius]